nr:MAG TPA: hypothetical protein [Caudoviricetes sp.]
MFTTCFYISLGANDTKVLIISTKYFCPFLEINLQK